MTGAAISNFLLSEGMKFGRPAISRIKLSIEASLVTNREVSYQKLKSYLSAMADKNPGSTWDFETEADGTFKRACFIPNIGVRIATMSRRMYGFDGAHLKGEMNSFGVFPVAICKYYNKQVTPFAIALVPKENEDHWTWFLKLVKEALAAVQAFTAVSDRQKGLINSVESTFPRAGHRYCLVHIKRNITETGKLTGEERNLISEMADSDCENDFNLFFSALASTNEKAVDKLATIKKEHWVKYEFLACNNLPTYGEATSNVSEQANNWIGNDCRTRRVQPFFHEIM